MLPVPVRWIGYLIAMSSTTTTWKPRTFLAALSGLLCASPLGCGAPGTAPGATELTPHGSASGGASGAVSSPGDGDITLDVGDGRGDHTGPPGELDLSMPPDFTRAELGGFKLGEPVPPEASNPTEVSGRTDGCGAVLTGVVRDFATRQNTELGHPDFGAGVSGLTLGLVQQSLDAERKPMASSGFASAFIESPQSFAQWYRDVPEHNLPYYLMLYLQPDDAGNVFSFQSHAFHPLDNEGFGNEYLDHNFHFTFELHTAFVYQGGEVFGFTGDDDLWVFINGKLAIDLGGVHGEEYAQVVLDEAADELELTLGQTYPLDFFHAERWCCGSNFAIQTTLTFTDCGSVPVIR